MATYKVTYFPARGGGEILRLTLSAAGQKFEDERITGDDWAKLKPNTPMKAMPLLTVTEGKGKSTTYCQSGATAKYIAKKYGLFGSTPEQGLLIDEVFECVADTAREMFKIVFEKDEAKKAEVLKKFTEEAIPKLAEYFNKRKSEFGQGGFIIGSKLTFADIALFNFVNQSTLMGLGSGWDKYPDLKTHSALVKQQKNIAAWLDKRPESEF